MVSVAVRVKPGSSRARVGGCHDGRFGPALIVAVTARAVDGQATAAVLRALATAFGVRDRDVRLRSGATSRDKLVEVSAPPSDVEARLRLLRDGIG